MRYAKSSLYRRFIWFLIVVFTLFSTPHVDLLLNSAANSFSASIISNAYAEETETIVADDGQEGSAETTEGKTPLKEKDNEKKTDKKAALQSSAMMASSIDGGGSSVAGTTMPAIDISQFSGSASADIPIEVPPGRLGMTASTFTDLQ